MWDVRTGDGEIVTTVEGLADALVTTRQGAVKQLLADAELLASAPEELVAEVKALARPEDQPATISMGGFVAWGDGRGRVDLIVKTGKVPGVTGDVVGTDEAPAARVAVWNDGKPTGEKVAVPAADLRRIEPLDTSKKDAVAVLVETVAAHEREIEERRLPEHARVTGDAVKTVFDRGMASWPGYDATTLHREDWALGRVEHFVKVATGDVEAKDAGHDTDLLHADHPVMTGEFVVSLADVDQQVKDLLAVASEE